MSATVARKQKRDLAEAGLTVPLWPTAGQAVGVSKSHAYALARRGEFPVRVLRLGAAYRVVTAELQALLGLPTDEVRGGAA
ncbi:putative DNA-binding transcriptional regulator AlpA [Rhodococcus sp. PvR044]|uniref:hypothetical protein n=1 Tax=Rhodococcus sp. PvR044 TaxID=3156402 RepID=UPI003396D7E8